MTDPAPAPPRTGKAFYDQLWSTQVKPELPRRYYNLQAVVDGLGLSSPEEEAAAYQAMARRWRKERRSGS